METNIKKLTREQILTDGSTKKLFLSSDPAYIFMEFKNDLALKDKKKPMKIRGKSQINNLVSSAIFQFLESYHVPTHFVGKLDDKIMVVKKLDMIPVDVVVRNISSESFSKTFKIPDGEALTVPIIEFYMKNEKLGNPFVNEYHLYAFGLSQQEEVKILQRSAAKVNALLKNFFDRRGYKLVQCRLEFGRYQNQILLGNEISLDTVKLWERADDRRLDKIIGQSTESELARIYAEFKQRIVSHK